MKEIKLNQGLITFIDDEDFELVSKYHWYAYKSNNTFYVQTKVTKDGKRVNIKMHRLIMNVRGREVIDHKDRNALNNTKSNLRLCNFAQNNCNKAGTGASKYRGVSIRKDKYTTKKGEERIYKYWVASIEINGKSKQIGSFKTEKEAALRYNEYAKLVHHEFAYINDVEI